MEWRWQGNKRKICEMGTEQAKTKAADIIIKPYV